MKKILKFLAVSLILSNLVFVSNVFAAGNESQVITKNLPSLDSMQQLTLGQNFNIKPNEDKFYKINIKGETYILESKSQMVNSPVSAQSSISPQSQSDSSATFTQDENVYANSGLLLGTLNMTQNWNYNNGKYTYLPKATLDPEVPDYSWPNYFNNTIVNPPVYNSSTGEYSSAGQGTLNNCVGPVTIQTFNLYITITFNAYGSAYGTAYYK
jgi:hypothetical protein